MTPFHAEGHSLTYRERRHRSPRMWPTPGPTEALLASSPIGGEHEILVESIFSAKSWRFPRRVVRVAKAD